MNSILVALLFLNAPAPDPPLDSLVVFTPPSEVSVDSDRIHIVGHSTAPLVGVMMNGRREGFVPVKDSVFHAHLEFGYGLNEILLTPRDSDSTTALGKTEMIQIMYGPTVAHRFQKVFGQYRFHGSTSSINCARCHDGMRAHYSHVSDEEACLDCHRDLRDMFREHIKEKEDSGACIICHFDLDRAGVDRSGNPCYHCHTDKIGEYAQEYIHGPVAGGGCVVCHNPHGSPYERNLNSPEPVLCFSCHQVLENELAMDYVHRPFANGRCVECHDPHSTSNKWVLVKVSEEVCLGCHLEMGSLSDHGHPYNVEPKKPLRVDLQLTEEGRLECISCHDPHATESAHLLRIPGQFNCVSCHDDKK